jgi:hypothetical protein
MAPRLALEKPGLSQCGFQPAERFGEPKVSEKGRYRTVGLKSSTVNCTTLAI